MASIDEFQSIFDGASGDSHKIPLVSLTKSLVHTYQTCKPGNFHSAKRLQCPRRALTKDPMPGGNFGFDNRNGDMLLVVGDIITNPITGQKFKIVDMLGQGTFGQVVKCRTLNQVIAIHQFLDDPKDNLSLSTSENLLSTPAMVAIKVVKNRPAFTNQAKVEIKILEKLVRADEKSGQDKKHFHEHIIHILGSFQYHVHMCIVFDLMSINLFELIKQNSFRGLSIHEIASFASQILAGMKVLSDLQIVHCDIKPENILIENFSNPPRVKIVDFGSACFENNTPYTYIQSRFYRAPEVMLGLPYTKSIDVWSFGCIMIELYMGLPAFPGVSNHNQLLRIEEMLGEFPEWMLGAGKQVKSFYNKVTVVEHETEDSLSLDEEGKSNSNSSSTGIKSFSEKNHQKRNRESGIGIGSDVPVMIITDDDALDALLNDTTDASGSEAKGFASPKKQKLRKKWILKSAEEYAFDESLEAVEKIKRYCKDIYLPDIILKCDSKRRPVDKSVADVDRNVLKSFLSFITGLLKLDPNDRTSVNDATVHPFISSSTMVQPSSARQLNSHLKPSLSLTPSLITPYGGGFNDPFSHPIRADTPYSLSHDWRVSDPRASLDIGKHQAHLYSNHEMIEDKPSFYDSPEDLNTPAALSELYLSKQPYSQQRKSAFTRVISNGSSGGILLFPHNSSMSFI